MTSPPNALTWGSPTATKHALLLHGVTSSAHTWHRVASSLADHGYFVTAPHLIGHGSRVSTDYHLSSMAKDLCSYLEATNYSLIIGHSAGTCVLMNLFKYLPPSRPTAILLVDPPMEQSLETLDGLRNMFVDTCTDIKLAEAHVAENPLWTREDAFYRELATRLCSIGGVLFFEQNRPWNFFHYLDAVPEKWKVSVVVADPAVNKLCQVEDILPYPHIRPVMVPGASHWIQFEFPEAIVEEALKRVSELDAA